MLPGSEPPLPLPAEFAGQRYEIGEELARGGMGLIPPSDGSNDRRDVLQ
jgi:hypothetical protein